MALTESTEGVEQLLEGVDAPEWAGAADISALVHDADEDPLTDRFAIADTGQADWAMRKLCRIVESSKEIEELAARQMEPIERWRKGEQARLDRERSFWEALLVEYHRGVIAEDDKAKSIRLPHGTLESRKLPDRWDFDEEAFLAWAAANAPEYVRVKTEIDIPLVKKTTTVDDDGSVRFKDGTGDDVPNVAVSVGERRFAVSPEGVAK
jgi:hypothetical protein